MPEGELLQNVVLSMNPCPICVDANGRQMTYEEWADSEWGLPGSSARYCEDDCHCTLVPVDAMGELPEISEQAKLRGEEGSELPAIIEISPSEQGLKEVMEEWNAKYGKLPREIYGMDLMKVEAYLRNLMKGMGGGPLARVADAEMAVLREKVKVTNKESATVFGTNGEVLIKKSGGRDFVDFTVDEMKAMEGAEIHIHSHPSSVSFSGQDIEHYAALQIKKGVVVSKDFIYEVEPPATGWPNSREISDEHFLIKRSLQSKYEAVYEANLAKGMSEAEASQATSRLHFDEVMEKLAEKYGLKYTRTGAE